MSTPVHTCSSGSGSDVIKDLLGGAVAGDFSKKQSLAKTVGQFGSSLIPIYGQIADARDTMAAFKGVYEGKLGAKIDTLVSLIAWIPLFGDLVKAERLGLSKQLRTALSEAKVKNSYDAGKLLAQATEELDSKISAGCFESNRLSPTSEPRFRPEDFRDNFRHPWIP